MHHNINHMIVSYIDYDYIFAPYDFNFIIPKAIELSDKLICLIKIEITRQCWFKLIEHMKIVEKIMDTAVRELPSKNLEGIGQLSADIVISKFPTSEEIEKEYSSIEEEKKEKARTKVSEPNRCCGNGSYMYYASIPYS